MINEFSRKAKKRIERVLTVHNGGSTSLIQALGISPIGEVEGPCGRLHSDATRAGCRYLLQIETVVLWWIKLLIP